MWLLHLVWSWLCGRLFGRPPGPSQEAVQAKAAGAAEASLATEKATNDAVIQAAQTRDAAARAVVPDDGLREYAARDPHNRDNR